MAQQQLSGVLLDFASRLRALAVDGIVEGSAAELAGGIPLRTFRYRLAALASTRVLERENAQGGRVRLVFAGFPRTATENGKSCRSEETRTARTATGGGGGRADVSTQLNDAPREEAQQQRQQAPDEEWQVRQETTPRTASLPDGIVRLTIEGAPAAIAPLIRALEGRVSPEKPEVRRLEVAVEDPELSPEAREALAFRVEQQRAVGFKKGEAAFRKHMRRVLAKNPREVKEILDEKRELEASSAPVASSKPAKPAPSAWEDALRLRSKIQKNGAASR